jgi:hypothetical protein
MNAPRTVQAGTIGAQWYFVALVTAAIAISYFYRQTLPVAISAIERAIPLNNQQFSWLPFEFLIPYAFLYPGGGRLLDVLGTRKGLILIIPWWSIGPDKRRRVLEHFWDDAKSPSRSPTMKCVPHGRIVGFADKWPLAQLLPSTHSSAEFG